MSSRKRSDAPDWERLVAKFEAAGSRDLVGFAKAHGVSAMRLQNHWYPHRMKRISIEARRRHRGRFVCGAPSPSISWTRSPTSTPSCATGPSAPERDT